MKAEHLINRYILVFVILLITSFLYVGLSEFLTAFLGAIIFYVLFRKFMVYLAVKKNFNKSLASVIIILISFLIVLLPIGILLLMIINKFSGLVSDPEKIKEYFNVLSDKLEVLPFKVSTDQIAEKVTQFVAEHAGGVISSSFSVFASLLMMYFLLYFLLMSVNSLEVKLMHYMPFDNNRIKLFGKELVDQTYANAIGVPAVATVQGFAAYGAYLIAGVPDAGVYAILTGFASIIPLVGTAIIWVPVAVYLLVSQEIWQGVFVIAFCIVVMTNLDNVVRMFVSKRIGDVHPITTVLGVIFGLKFFSLPGLVFGPLLISYLFLLIKIFHVEYNSSHSSENEEEIAEAEENQQLTKAESNAILKMFNKFIFFTEGLKKPADEDKNPLM
jgi:predicted PurR-regulated permease PerM